MKRTGLNFKILLCFFTKSLKLVCLSFIFSMKKAEHVLKKFHLAELYFLCCSVAQSCPTLCDPTDLDWSMPGFPVLYYLLEFTQTQAHWVGDAIQPSHPLSAPSPPVLNLSQHQGLFQWVSPLHHQVVKLSELQLQHQSFQWIFRVDFL